VNTLTESLEALTPEKAKALLLVKYPEMLNTQKQQVESIKTLLKENADLNERIRDLAGKLRNYELAGKALKHFLTEAR